MKWFMRRIQHGYAVEHRAYSLDDKGVERQLPIDQSGTKTEDGPAWMVNGRQATLPVAQGNRASMREAVHHTASMLYGAENEIADPRQ